METTPLTMDDVKEVARYWAAQQRRDVEQAYERRHPGFTKLSAMAKLRVIVEDALLADVPPPPNTFAEVVRIQKERGQR